MSERHCPGCGRGSPIRTSGQATVEFALVVPLLIVALFAALQFGWYIFQLQTLNQAVREGARYAIVHGSTALCPSGPMPGGAANWCDPSGQRIQAVVLAHAVGFPATGVSFPTLAWSPDNARGSTFSLVVASTFQPLLPDIPFPSVPMQGSADLVIQH